MGRLGKEEKAFKAKKEARAKALSYEMTSQYISSQQEKCSIVEFKTEMQLENRPARSVYVMPKSLYFIL